MGPLQMAFKMGSWGYDPTYGRDLNCMVFTWNTIYFQLPVSSMLYFLIPQILR